MISDYQNSIKALTEIGLNNLEAEIYLELSNEPGASGYKIAKNLKKQTANIYKALETLQAKGAILTEANGSNSTYYAVPVSDYMDILEIELKRKRAETEEVLKNLKKSKPEEKIYKLESVAQTIQIARKLIDTAKTYIVAEVYPAILPKLRESFAEAAARGVKVILQVYDDIEIPGCDLRRFEGGELHLKLWNAQFFWMGVDRKEALVSCYEKSGQELYQAVYSKNEFLSAFIMAGLMQNLHLHNIMEDLTSAQNRQDIERVIAKYADLQYQNSIYTRDCRTEFYQKLTNWDEFDRQLRSLKERKDKIIIE